MSDAPGRSQTSSHRSPKGEGTPVSDAPAREIETRSERGAEERKALRSYVWGVGLALLLTVLPFALVHWAAMSRFWLLIVIGALALAQMVVHFRFFLHIGFKEKREDLQLIVFSALLLLIMVAGTIWIMASLAVRMALPGPI
jgi:cytochrome o ubiquinol oxidase operon protein cyoD